MTSGLHRLLYTSSHAVKCNGAPLFGRWFREGIYFKEGLTELDY
jgi:hypothetical protein